MTFSDEKQGPFVDYKATSGDSRLDTRKIERLRRSNGKLNRTRKMTSTLSFNPSFPLDGQALAGTGALVFEGELLEQ